MLTYRDHNCTRQESPSVYRCLSNLQEQSIFLKKDFIYLIMRDTEREAET